MNWDDQNKSGIQLQRVLFVHALGADRSSPKCKSLEFYRTVSHVIYLVLQFASIFFFQFCTYILTNIKKKLINICEELYEKFIMEKKKFHSDKKDSVAERNYRTIFKIYPIITRFFMQN